MIKSGLSVLTMIIMAWFGISPVRAISTEYLTKVEKTPENSIYESTSAAVTDGGEVPYDLAYHGMLTDHPLYFLKSLRDTLMDFLITDQSKKIEFAILKADKFTSMSSVYIQQEEWENVSDVLKQARINDSDASDKAQILQKNHNLPPHTSNRLYLSLTKQRQMVSKLAVGEKINESVADHLTELDRMIIAAEKLKD